jgi:type IV pilus assembly protein PilF
MKVKILSISFLFFLLACQSSSNTQTYSSSSRTNKNYTSSFKRDKAAQVRLSAGLQYLRVGNLKNAKRHLDKALEFGKDIGGIHFALAYYYEKIKEFEKAEISYKKSLLLEPKNPDFLNGYASYLCEKKRYDKANEYYKQAISMPIYPEIASAYLNAGICSKREGKLEKAHKYFRKALNQNPKLGRALLEMAKLKFERKEYIYSFKYLKRLESLMPRPNPETLWLGLRLAYYEKDKNAQASYANKLEQLFPDSNETEVYLKSKKQWLR